MTDLIKLPSEDEMTNGFELKSHVPPSLPKQIRVTTGDVEILERLAKEQGVSFAEAARQAISYALANRSE